ncbi:MAG: rhomboid family intramembrane serine protease [Pirellulales bacterium]
MGIYDRDYAREEPRGLQLGGDWSAVGTIIVLNVVFYFLELLAGSKFAEALMLRGDVFTRPETFWRLFTYGWVHDQDSLVHLVMNLIVLWFFGRDVEHDLYTKARFWRFYMSAMVVAGLGWALVQQSWFPHGHNAPSPEEAKVIGASGAIMGVVALAILKRPKQTVLLFGVVPVPMWLLGVFYLVSDISGALRRGDENIAYSAHLIGAASGLLYYRTNWCLADIIPWNRVGRLFERGKPAVKLHRPSVDDRDEYDDDDDLSSRVDDLLAKIHAHGEKSLTTAERKFLENASRKLRNRQRR